MSDPRRPNGQRERFSNNIYSSNGWDLRATTHTHTDSEHTHEARAEHTETEHTHTPQTPRIDDTSPRLLARTVDTYVTGPIRCARLLARPLATVLADASAPAAGLSASPSSAFRQHTHTHTRTHTTRRYE